MSEFKVGDKVLVEATITNVDYASDTYCIKGSDKCRWERKKLIHTAQKTYEDGLNEAWELAGKLFNMPSLELDKIFGKNAWNFSEIMKCSPQEVNAKIKAFGDKKEFNVGDVVEEVEINNGFAIVTHIDEYGKCSVIWDDGSCGVYDKNDFVKTGRTIDVEILLKQIGGAE